LYLQVTDGGASWLLRYEIQITPIPNGKWLEQRGRRERWLGLGSLSDFSLKEARERARAARKLLADGIDPLVQKSELHPGLLVKETSLNSQPFFMAITPT
jgi:hypothetical protein